MRERNKRRISALVFVSLFNGFEAVPTFPVFHLSQRKREREREEGSSSLTFYTSFFFLLPVVISLFSPTSLSFSYLSLFLLPLSLSRCVESVSYEKGSDGRQKKQESTHTMAYYTVQRANRLWSLSIHPPLFLSFHFEPSTFTHDISCSSCCSSLTFREKKRNQNKK